MEGRLSIRLFVAILAVAISAACSSAGGTGSGSVMPPGASYPGSTPLTNSSAHQESAASSALAIAGNSTDVNSFGTESGAMAFTIRRALAERNHPSASTPSPTIACDNGVEFFQSGSGSGAFTNTAEYFYDAKCAQPRRLDTFTITLTATGGTITGTEELWDSSGNVVDYKTDSGTFTASEDQVTQLTLERTVAAAPSASPFAQSGVSCTFGGSASVDCGNATVATVDNPQWDPHIYATMTPGPGAQLLASPGASTSPTVPPTPFEIGFSGTVEGAQTTPSPSASATPPSAWGWSPQPLRLQLTIAGTGSTGYPQSMTIASPAPATTPPAWTVSGGTQVTTLSGTATLGFGPSGLFNSADITLTDTADGLTITFTSASRGGLTGTMTNTSLQTLATVTVDANGDGVIDYTTGATAQIRDWVILTT